MEISKWRSIRHEDYIEIPGFSDVSRDKELYAKHLIFIIRSKIPSGEELWCSRIQKP